MKWPLLLLVFAGIFRSAAQPPLFAFVDFKCKNHQLASVEKEINKQSNLDTVISLVDRYINPNNNDYAILKCASCPKGKKIFQFPLAPKEKSGRIYAGYYSRGDEEVFSMQKLHEVFRDTLTAIDSFFLPVAGLQDQHFHTLQSLRVAYDYNGRHYVRPVGFWPDKAVLALSREAIFGPMSEDAILSVPLTVYVKTAGSPIFVGKPFYLRLLSGQEKSRWLTHYQVYRKEFPAFSEEEIQQEMTAAMQAVYQNLSTSNVVNWLNPHVSK